MCITLEISPREIGFSMCMYKRTGISMCKDELINVYVCIGVYTYTYKYTRIDRWKDRWLISPPGVMVLSQFTPKLAMLCRASSWIPSKYICPFQFLPQNLGVFPTHFGSPKKKSLFRGHCTTVPPRKTLRPHETENLVIVGDREKGPGRRGELKMRYPLVMTFTVCHGKESSMLFSERCLPSIYRWMGHGLTMASPVNVITRLGRSPGHLELTVKPVKPPLFFGGVPFCRQRKHQRPCLGAGPTWTACRSTVDLF